MVKWLIKNLKRKIKLANWYHWHSLIFIHDSATFFSVILISNLKNCNFFWLNSQLLMYFILV